MQKQGNDISKAAGKKAWSVEEKEKKTLNWQKRKKNSFRHQTDKVCLSISFLCAYCFFPVVYNRKQARVLWAIFSSDFKQRRLETRRSIQTQSKWNVEFGSFVYICLSISTLNETKIEKLRLHVHVVFQEKEERECQDQIAFQIPILTNSYRIPFCL